MTGKAGNDYWKWPSRLFLWAVIGWLAWQVGGALIDRYRMIQTLNRAAVISDRDIGHAASLISQVQFQELASTSPAGETFLNFLGIAKPSFAPTYSTIYSNLAYKYYDQDEIRLAVRAWSLALVNQPDLQIPAHDLGAACMRLDKWELGYFAAKRVGHEQLVGYFSRHYSPPWD